MDSRIQKCQFTETLGRSAQSGVNVAYITSESGVKISECLNVMMMVSSGMVLISSTGTHAASLVAPQ